MRSPSIKRMISYDCASFYVICAIPMRILLQLSLTACLCLIRGRRPMKDQLGLMLTLREL